MADDEDKPLYSFAKDKNRVHFELWKASNSNLKEKQNKYEQVITKQRKEETVYANLAQIFFILLFTLLKKLRRFKPKILVLQ